MSKPRTGSVVYVPPKPGEAQGHYKARITDNDGSRPWIHFAPSSKSPEAEARAREKAAHHSERFAKDDIRGVPQRRRKRATAAPLAGVSGESGGDWWSTYFAHREAKGLTPVGDLHRAHIEPVLGDLHPRDWTAEDCERLRDALDAKIAAGSWERDGRRYSFGWKRAWNVWSLFTAACKVASRSKLRELRVRKDNPCADIDPPDRGEHKQKQWLYPAELLALVSCEKVPLHWRRLYALLAYTYVRAGELKVLEWSDVDLDAGTLHITKAWDDRREIVSAPKSSAGVRYLPLELALLPLLEAMRAELGGVGRVVKHMPGRKEWAPALRRHLQRAGVTRAALFEDSATVKHITLHDLRATGITWRCLRRDYGPEIQQAAGHEKYDTTDGYVRSARVFAGRVGEPFPELPPSLLDTSNRPSRPTIVLAGRNSSEVLWRRRELNPGPQGIQLAFVHVRSRITQAAGFVDSANDLAPENLGPEVVSTDGTQP